MPIEARILGQLHAAILQYPEFFYDLFVDESFSNSVGEQMPGRHSPIIKFFQKFPDWQFGPLQLFNEDTSRLSGPTTVAKHSKADLDLPKDQIPPLRASHNVEVFYKLRNVFNERFDKKTKKIKNLSEKEEYLWKQKLNRILTNPINQDFVDTFLAPVLQDVSNPNMIKEYQDYKQKQEQHKKPFSKPADPIHFNPPDTVKNMQEWVDLINSIYTGDLKPGVLEDIYSEEDHYLKAFTTIEKALNLNLNLQPGHEDFIKNHIYNVLISYIAQKMLVEEDPAELKEKFQQIFEKSASSSARYELIEQVATQVEKYIEKATHNFEFYLSGYKFNVQGMSNDKTLYFFDTKRNSWREISKEDFLNLLKQSISSTLDPRSKLYQNLIPIVNNIKTVATIAIFGFYKEPLINGMYNPVNTTHSANVSLLKIYEIMEQNSIPKPANFESFDLGKKKLYNLLGNLVDKTKEHVLARRFAIYAMHDPQSMQKPDPSIRLVNSFKSENNKERRIRYLVLEIIRSRVKPKNLKAEFGDFPELKLAAKLYQICLKESKSASIPTNSDLEAIKTRISKGELDNQDLATLIRHTNKSLLDNRNLLASYAATLKFNPQSIRPPQNPLKRLKRSIPPKL